MLLFFLKSRTQDTHDGVGDSEVYKYLAKQLRARNAEKKKTVKKVLKKAPQKAIKKALSKPIQEYKTTQDIFQDLGELEDLLDAIRKLKDQLENEELLRAKKELLMRQYVQMVEDEFLLTLLVQ